MRKTFLVFLVSLCGLGSAQAQNQPAAFSYDLMGHIGDTPVKMHLKRHGNKRITGYYGQAQLTQTNNYVKQQYHLEGRIDQHDHIKLTVYPPRTAKERYTIKAHFKQKQGHRKLLGHFYHQGEQNETHSKTVHLRQYHIQYHDYKLTDQHQYKTNTEYCYNMAIHFPHLQHSQHQQAVKPFNQHINQLIKTYQNSLMKEIKKRRKASHGKFAKDPKCPNIDQDRLWVDYIVTNIQHNILSLRFQITRFSARAAHPNHYSYALNYDLKHNRFINLHTLFQSNVSYLQKLADFSRHKLNKKLSKISKLDDFQKRWIQEGTEPKADNYDHHWNLRPNGLLLHFDPYQVAPYAYGDIELLIPANKLQPLLCKQYADLFTSS